MHTPYIIGLLLLLQLAGCAVSRTETVSGTLQGGTVVVERLPPATQEPGATAQPLNIDAPGGSVIIERLPPLPEVVPEVPVAAAPPIIPQAPIAPLAENAAPVPPTATASPVAPVAAPDNTAVKPPVKPAAPVARAATPQKPATTNARVAAATLDLDALEQRLKDTDAIGVFTKIALKNQVDDLLKRFRAYHQSDGKTALTQLRQSYDQLLLKVNDVLKNGDPSLAGEIMGSREAIWGVLSDPVKFAKL
jgi:hypothetical protein